MNQTSPLPRVSETDFIARARALTARLRALDARRVVFGAGRHRHDFLPPLSPQQVAEWERVHAVRLPDAYRRFLLELGNGGAGPYYGIEPLPLDAPWLREPFPFVESVKWEDAPDDGAPYWESPLPGAVTLAQYGCGAEFLLVLQGASAGQIWFDVRYETGIWRFDSDFDEWWLGMMQSPLERFEQILALMQAATPHEEIHRTLEPGVLQLEVDNTMLSLMNANPEAKPRVYADKPWGKQCGLVEQHYGAWLRAQRRE